ncbi:MAG: ATP-binding protein [Myxococcaceae bacterium]|nr:ATP-binding protein [Myxococcaceae bacterium]
MGKTTLARQIGEAFDGPVSFFDLEDSRARARLEDPMMALSTLKGLVVLDEVQHVPEIFQSLRVLADRPRGARFLVLGSASPTLLRQSSESLAGRIAYLELPPLGLPEVGLKASAALWLRGGFPRSFTARTQTESADWRRGFLRTFLERDIPQLGIGVAAPTLRRFWSMLSHLHGQTLNLSELGRSLGVADTTVRHYLDILEGTFMAWQLQPWHENLSKRQVKAPKVYLSDTGILHSLLGIESHAGLEGHPKVGASWEGFCIGTLLAHLKVPAEQRYFWATHAGAELDLLVVHDGVRRGFEIKRTSSPKVTPSMRAALADLKLASLDVIYSGDETFLLAPKVRAVPLKNVTCDIH